jgi:hypothetical protein
MCKCFAGNAVACEEFQTVVYFSWFAGGRRSYDLEDLEGVRGCGNANER